MAHATDQEPPSPRAALPPSLTIRRGSELAPHTDTLPTGLPPLDAFLGGLPLRHTHLIAGTEGAGATTLLHGLLATVTRDHPVLLLDPRDRFFPAGAASLGVHLPHLLRVPVRDPHMLYRALAFALRDAACPLIIWDAVLLLPAHLLDRLRPDVRASGCALLLAVTGVPLAAPGIAAGTEERASRETLHWLATLTTALDGVPRHTSIHNGGMVVTARPLAECLPIERARMKGRTVVIYDKDDLESLGYVKTDLLGLGMLTAIRKCFELIRETEGRSLMLDTVPLEDPAVYDMFGKGDTVGVFQIESRAQQATLPRTLPRTLYDLVIETALIRPGPIQGASVSPLILRRQGREPVTYPHQASNRSSNAPTARSCTRSRGSARRWSSPGSVREKRTSCAGRWAASAVSRRWRGSRRSSSPVADSVATRTR
jgi:DNA polymerase III alpha subunit